MYFNLYLNLDFKGFGYKYYEKCYKMESEFFVKDGCVYLL